MSRGDVKRVHLLGPIEFYTSSLWRWRIKWFNRHGPPPHLRGASRYRRTNRSRPALKVTPEHFGRSSIAAASRQP